MTDIILHHYDLSPFSEKIRRILAYKEIPWRAVEQPIMAPKPELTPLTGGYRRIPVMQIGADLYCDTALIARRLEALFPERPINPRARAGAIAMIEDWADHRLFTQVVPPVLVALLDVLPPGFMDDRAAMTPSFQAESVMAAAPHALTQTRRSLDHLDTQLRESAFLLGDAFSLADAACFHCVNFLLNNPELQPEVDRRTALAGWLQRIRAFGPGKVEALAGSAALDIARDAEPTDTDGDSVSDAPIDASWGIGDTVSIVADDYGQETTVGEVIRVLADEITVVREDPQVGAVAVHYPRAGYRITQA